MYTILFADDIDIVRDLFSDALRRSGYCVLEAEDGARALSLARGHCGPINLLIADVLMPRLSGPELWRELRACHPETGVLFISGYAGNEADFNAPFLQKPFTPATLLARVRDMLQVGEAPQAFAPPPPSA